MDHAKIEGDEIVIRMKISELNGAAYQGLDQCGVEDDGEMDFEQLAPDLVKELNREEEDGTTLIHRALDSAVVAASENGSEAFAYLDE
ncbi:hypothetical protein [uncultured Ruegeria sp.]|uniref:hypothetical protein n=1 Tax=uncultured Ruegeria sp. TaxID=259304 RepID=UPI00262A3B8A|nr:hypothetical protein [uncultured Ruegeria sp.]